MKPVSSSKSRWIKFFSIVLVHILLVIGDVYATYLYTPELSMESNPFVSLFGLGWTSLIIVSVLAVIVFSYFMYFPFVYYKREVIPCKGFKEYVSKAFLNRSDKNKRYALVPLGFLVAAAGIVGRIYVILKSILYINDLSPCIFCILNKEHTYCNTVVLKIGNGQWIIPFVMLTIVGLITLLSVFLWLFKEYKINQKALKNLKNDL